jgi:electron transfer flavoprotein alpha/beta subunit
MKIIALVRLTYEPKEVAELTLGGGKIQAGRVNYSLNEGDIKGVQLIKSLKSPFDAISVGVLNNIARVHTFVRGAENIFEIGEQFAHNYDESILASMIAAQIKNIGGVQVVVCSPVEQDSGRGLLPGILAAKLGFELFTSVKKISEKDGAVLIEQQLETGVQSFQVKGPLVICPDETCILGDDPSDAFDLIEKLEKKETKKIKAEQLLSGEKSSIESSLDMPKVQSAQPVVPYSNDVVKKVLELIKPFAG